MSTEQNKQIVKRTLDELGSTRYVAADRRDPNAGAVDVQVSHLERITLI